MGTYHLENYLALLAIRRRGWRRSLLLSGGVFAVSFVGLLALGMLGRLNALALYLSTGMVTAFAFSSITAWVRWTTAAELAELAETLKRDIEAPGG